MTLLIKDCKRRGIKQGSRHERTEDMSVKEDQECYSSRNLIILAKVDKQLEVNLD